MLATCAFAQHLLASYCSEGAQLCAQPRCAKPPCRCSPRSSTSRPAISTGDEKDYARRGQRCVKAAGTTLCHNKTGGMCGYIHLGQRSSSTMRRRRRVVPWGGVGSSRRGSHIWHQSKARTTQGLGGRQTSAAGRRRDGEGGSRLASA